MSDNTRIPKRMRRKKSAVGSLLSIAMVIMLMLTALLASMALGTFAEVTQPVEVFMELKRNPAQPVPGEPYLYDVLWLTVRASTQNNEKTAVVVVNRQQMSQMNTGVKIGDYTSGQTVYLWYEMWFDSAAGNDYMGYEAIRDGEGKITEYRPVIIAETSYLFTVTAGEKMEKFSILQQSGSIFTNQGRLNPGDLFTGNLQLGIGKTVITTPVQPGTGGSGTPGTPGIPGTPGTPGTPVPSTTIEPPDSQVPGPPPTITTEEHEVPGTVPIGPGLPKTFDDAPLGLLAAISGIAACLLAVQLMLLRRRKKAEDKRNASPQA
ncbi:MAG: hypothetical protein SCM88_10220 [Bacillota bacterium]|nr:hypothetical protein [Bacillota bacterium]